MGKADWEVSEGDHEVGFSPWFSRGGRSCCCCLLWGDTVLSDDSTCFVRFDLVFLTRVPRRAVGSALASPLGLQARLAGAARIKDQ